MRIVHITSVHQWDDIRINIKMCRYLSQAGHDVHLVAPVAGISDGEIRHGVSIHPMETAFNRIQRFFKSTSRSLDRAREIGGDIYHFHDPEFLPYAVNFQQKTGSPVVYDAHEDFRIDITTKGYIPKGLRTALAYACGIMEDFVCSRLAGISCATPHIARHFIGHPNCAVIQNFPILSESNFPSLEKVEAEPGLFAYVGGINSQRGIQKMIDAVSKTGPSARLALAGPWESPECRNICMELKGWAQVENLGVLNREGIWELLSRAQAGLVVIAPTPTYIESLPIKLFEYMLAGLPVIASNFPLWHSIVGDAECGIFVDPCDSDAISEAMTWILKNPESAREMGNRGRQAVLEKYDWEKEFEKLIKLYLDIIRKG